MKNPLHSEPVSASESGNALLELAVSLPLFLLLILGTAEIANLAWASVQVNNAARAGAAFASSSRTNAADIPHILLAAQNEAPALTITFPSPPTQLCSCVNSGTPSPLACDASALSNCPAPGVIQVAVQINASAAVTPLVHYPGLPASFTVRAKATVGVGQ